MPGFHGLPCWYELGTNDLEGAKAFYTATLGWNVADSGTPGMTYLVASIGEVMVAGMMKNDAAQPVAWSIYFAVDNADATVAAAQALGAKVNVPPTDIPNTGRFAVLADPQGASFGVLQPLPGGAGGAFDQKKMGHGNWNELITPDPAAALAFYGKLFGWTESRSMEMGPDMTYHLIAHDGLDIGGTYAMPGSGPMWKPYFGVASTKAAQAAVAAARGRVLRGPDEVPGGAFTLQITDPQGAVLALVGPA
ncbi:MAG: VOC family protein [Cypionkella sp.]